MERRAWILRIKEGKEEQYSIAHQSVWPELIQASKKAGFRNHSVFLHDRTVVAYLEAEDVEAAETELAQSAVLREWDQAMSELLEETSTPPLKEVFHFD